MTSTGILRENRDFRRFWTGSTLSTLGSQMSLIAFPLLVLSLGAGAAEAGLVATCSLVTRLALRLPAGNLVDRTDRRRLMLATDLVRLVALGSIPIAGGFGALGYPQLLVVAIVEGSATALFGPASRIAVRDVVPEHQLSDALSKEQAALGTATLVGPFLGGWLFAVDRILPFTADALSYAVSAVLLLGMATRPQPADPATPRPTGALAGVRWLGRRPALLRALLFGSLLNLGGAAAEVAVVVTLREKHTAGTVIGLVMACAGVGAVLGALAAPRVIALLDPGPLFLVVGVVWTFGFAAFAAAPTPLVVGPVLVLLIFLTPPAGILVGRVLLTESPRELLGRISTAADLLMAGLASLGPAAAGVLLQDAGISRTWVLLAAVIAAGTAVAALPLLRGGALSATAESGSSESVSTESGSSKGVSSEEQGLGDEVALGDEAVFLEPDLVLHSESDLEDDGSQETP
ncbi:MFS transporter [Catenulispora sp. NF23]|uniref:MFS transporter n=1 Tax=Catenulispora pinistramenti TaxID=2705254 RepID=UPI001BAD1B6C|nr:MFS transporter [Catenulispora pinistramenti]MBS2535983.1 MFS transporter [Catenulispora pinistramenti]